MFSAARFIARAARTSTACNAFQPIGYVWGAALLLCVCIWMASGCGCGWHEDVVDQLTLLHPRVHCVPLVAICASVVA